MQPTEENAHFDLRCQPYLSHANGPRSRRNSRTKDSIPVNEKKLDESPILSFLSWRYVFVSRILISAVRVNCLRAFATFQQFPGIKNAPPAYWHRIQTFFDGMCEANLSCTPERGEVTKRRMMAMAFTRLFATFAAVGLPAVGESEPAGMDEAMAKEIDDLFEEGDPQKAAWVTAGKEVERLRVAWKNWVKNMYQGGKLTTYEF